MRWNIEWFWGGERVSGFIHVWRIHSFWLQMTYYFYLWFQLNWGKMCKLDIQYSEHTMWTQCKQKSLHSKMNIIQLEQIRAPKLAFILISMLEFKISKIEIFRFSVSFSHISHCENQNAPLFAKVKFNMPKKSDWKTGPMTTIANV